jgi:hypothetical protein
LVIPQALRGQEDRLGSHNVRLMAGLAADGAIERVGGHNNPIVGRVVRNHVNEPFGSVAPHTVLATLDDPLTCIHEFVGKHYTIENNTYLIVA